MSTKAGRDRRDRVSAALRRLAGAPLPRSDAGARAVLAAHILGKAVERRHRDERPLGQVARGALMDAIFLETTLRRNGRNQMVRGRHGFFPHIFMPDFHGPHFDEALRRLTLPGRGPNVVYFSTTSLCPCSCEYCFAGAGGAAGEAQEDALDDARVVLVAKALARKRVPLVNLSGGEPLARFPRLLSVVGHLAEGCEVRMFTTGIGLTPERLAQLRDAGLRGLFVSLDTADAVRHDRVRGFRGAFDAAVRALRLASEQGMLVFINSVVSKSSFPDAGSIRAFLELAQGIHPDIVVNFLPQLATGRGKDGESFRTPDECDPIARRIVETAAALERPIAMLFGDVDRFMGCVGAGGKLLNIDIQGNVTVCISRGGLGNVLEEPFDAIYARYVERCKELKVGFFCCHVGERTEDAELLDAARTRRELDAFYAETPDATWQEVLRKYGWLLSRIVA